MVCRMMRIVGEPVVCTTVQGRGQEERGERSRWRDELAWVLARARLTATERRK